ncbi:MAG: hypothetical protein K2X93_23440 [Candidatus Obscuribacterales bacterium]|nr:hypothetical protein [Candidatus Obscuribacterales bacterium]
MSYFQIASNHNSFGSSTCITQGSFQSPGSLLSIIASAKATELGVVDITGKLVSGRLLIADNDTISGCVIDGTGETGTGAVCKLLLLPFGNFVFRQAVPQDEWELQQQLELTSDAVASFLAGPSSIGLASHATAALDLCFEPEAPPYSPENDYVQSLIDAVGVATVLQDQPDTSLEKTARFPACQEHSRDCQKLVEGVAQRKLTSEVDFRIREKRVVEKIENIEPQSKVTRPKQSEILVAMLGFGLFIAFAMVSLASSISDLTSNTSSSSSKPIAATIAFNHESTEQSSNEGEEQQPTRYSFPARAAYNSEPPPVSKSNTISHRVTFDKTDIGTAPAGEQTSATSGSQVDDTQVVSFWVKEIKKNPNDPAAREQLAYTLLRVDRAEISIEQFQALMHLRNVSAEELIRYTSALSMYNHKALAAQLLRSVLSTDPNNDAVRAQLAQMETVSQ